MKVKFLVVLVLIAGTTKWSGGNNTGLQSYHPSSKSEYQNNQLTIDIKDWPLSKVLEELEEISDYSFVYNEAAVQNIQIRELSFRKSPLIKILDFLEKNYTVEFLVLDTTVSVKITGILEEAKTTTPEPPASKIPSIDISGRVVDAETNEPLVGATVQVLNSGRGTSTDIEGRFKMDELDKGDTLVISYIGYISKRVPLTPDFPAIIQLMSNSQQLDEVVVIGYGTQKKINLTGSVSTVNSTKLLQTPVASVSQSLAGRLPGLISKQSEGKPGANPNISIRGFGSPLVIVDGIEQDNYANIDPNEIESISILKDASAAVYGARAGNGVLLITTKRGKIGKPKITFSHSSSFQTPTAYPEFVDSWEYAVIQNEANEFAGQSPVYSSEDIEKFKSGTDPEYANVKHYDEIIKKWSPMKENNLNVSGGSDMVRYFLSAGYFFQDGIYNSDGVNLNRYNVRSNIDIHLTNNLTVGLDLSARNTTNHDVPFSSRDIFQTIGTTTNRFPSSYPDPEKKPFVGRSSHSPYIKIDPDISGYNNTSHQYLTGALTLQYDFPFINGLNLKIRGNYIGDQRYGKQWTKSFSTYNYDRVNEVYTIASSGGRYSLQEQENRRQELTFQGLLEYKNRFEDHEINVLLVNEIIDIRSNWFNAYKDGFISGALDQMFAGSSENMSTNGSAYEESRMSYVSRINYAFLSKYLFEATLRYDGSSRFSPDQRWALFPSISAGWRISEESFIQNALPALSNWKLRLSYSHTGYDRNATAYQYLSTYGFSTQYIFGETPYKTIRTNGIENPSISWEDIYTFNIGTDLEWWYGLLGAQIDLFYRLREGILGNRTAALPNTFGATLPQENINSNDNRGIELTLKHAYRLRDFNYSLGLNFSWTREKYVENVEQIYDDPDQDRIYRKSGQWVNRTFGYTTDGFFQSQEEIDESTIDYDQNGNATLQPGQIKYVDVNEDQLINWRDMVEIGRGGTPEIMYGINFSCNYNNFDLSMLWQGASNFNILFSQNMRTLTINSVWNSYKFLYDDRWTPENPDSEFPRTTNGHNSYNNRTSDLWLKPGNYIRLKSFAVGYNLPDFLVKKIKVERIRAYIAGYNTITFSRLDRFPFDPEGIGTSWTYPNFKSYSFGLNIVL